MWRKLEHPDQGFEMVKSLTFNNFIDAFAYCTRVAMIAEKMNHHPTITIEYNKVTISTTTHDSGNSITEKDESLMAEINKLLD
jgi:4a-hydroxytetrahydrobiopterin dehydratase